MSIDVIADEDILGIAGDLWSSYLEDEAMASAPGALVPEISSNVSVFGGWIGVVVLSRMLRSAC